MKDDKYDVWNLNPNYSFSEYGKFCSDLRYLNYYMWLRWFLSFIGCDETGGANVDVQNFEGFGPLLIH